jgi:hypothetical protein
MFRKYDDWKLDTPDNHVNEIGKCKQCELVVYKEQDHIRLSEGLFHNDCFWEYEAIRTYEEEFEWN